MYTCTKVVHKMFVCKIVGGGGVGIDACTYSLVRKVTMYTPEVWDENMTI